MMTEVKDKKWYVVRAISGQENKIKTYIEEEIKRLKIDSFVDDITMASYDSEMDLDRDVPSMEL